MKPFLQYNTAKELCSWYHWDDVQVHVDDEMFVAALGICWRDDHLVLTRHHKRGWELPSGRREEGEEIMETLLREVREETGGEIIDPVRRAVIVWDHHDSDTVHYGVLYTGGWEKRGYDLVDDARDAALVAYDDLAEYLGDTPIGQGGLSLIDYFFSS